MKPIQNPLDLIQAKREKLDHFCRSERVELLIIFGSAAAWRFHAASDLDIAVQFPKGKVVSKLHLIYRLETILEPWTVDLVVLTQLTPPLLLHEIFTNGSLIFEGTEGLFEKEKLRVWHLYVDSAKLRREATGYVSRMLRRMTHVP
jgi:predicted nucleotidyltransferase